MELCVCGLEIARGARVLVRGLDLRVVPGQIWAVLGRNGSGKSSLLQVLTGELRPRAGTVRLGDVALAALSARERARRVAWQGELPRADFGFRIHERLELVPREGRSVRQALVLLELVELAERRLFELSSGERQRVELAALWLREAPLWLLDEPMSHLDLRHQVRWLELLRSEARSGRSLVVVLHDLTQAAALADHVVLLGDETRPVVGCASDLLDPVRLAAFYATPIERLGTSPGAPLVPAYGATRNETRDPSDERPQRREQG